ncbi:hypothetical protein C8J56DRAFT_1003166 [Mycena floridula]|nr:hypothetical protein C8J56DRAFT_1003166 [Mycena floridula]
MPPKKGTRKQAVRQVNNIAISIAPEIIAKRNQRHLEDLERSNYAESGDPVVGEDNEDGAPEKYTKGRARHTISDKRNLKLPGNSAAATKKKSNMKIRTALIYRTNLAKLVEESNIAALPARTPTYLTAQTPPSKYPPRMMCSVCGYWGQYKCRKCSMPYCDRNCESVHDETRCERRVV